MRFVFIISLLLGCSAEKPINEVHFDPSHAGTHVGGDLIPVKDLTRVKNEQELVALIKQHWSMRQIEDFVEMNEPAVGYQGITAQVGRVEGAIYTKEVENSEFLDEINYVGIFERERLLSMSLIIIEKDNSGAYWAEYHLGIE